MDTSDWLGDKRKEVQEAEEAGRLAQLSCIMLFYILLEISFHKAKI